MSSLWVEVIIISLLILLNGVFAMVELAVVSARKNRLAALAHKGNRGASTALHLAENPNQFLSTTQIGITLISILNGAFGGATIADDIALLLRRIPALVPYSHALGVATVVVIITYLSLVVGELVPKRLALFHPEAIATRLSGLMALLARLTAPLVTLLSLSTEAALRIIGARPTNEPPVTEEDVQSMIRQGTRIGIFEAAEQEMVTQVFRLGDRRVSTVMTPRTDIEFLDIDFSSQEIIERVVHSNFSRYPVFRETPDDVIGLVKVKDLFNQAMQEQPLDLNAILRPALFLPESMTILNVLERMKEAGQEAAMVIDEYGGLAGMVTLNDILEAVVGDIELPEPGEEPEITRRTDGSYLMDGMLLVDEVNEALGIEEQPEGPRDYDTLGGLIMTELGRIPKVGDELNWDGYRFEVVDMDGLRVDKVLAVPLKEGG